jgi:hypothetical protein
LKIARDAPRWPGSQPRSGRSESRPSRPELWEQLDGGRVLAVSGSVVVHRIPSAGLSAAIH